MTEFIVHSIRMPEPISPTQHPHAATRPLTPIAWPVSLLIAIAATMILLALFTSMDLPNYIHRKSVPRAAIWVVVAAYSLTVMVWLIVETRSTWYLQISTDHPRVWFRHHLRRLPVFIIGFIVLGYGLRIGGLALLGMHIRLTPQYVVGQMIIYESLKATLLYCCWLGLAFGVLSFIRMRQQTEHLLTAQKTLVEAKLMQLQGQLRPHFLFNTLNTISSLMQVDVARADKLLTQLGDLLRANLNVSERDVVPLSEELGLLRQYADIMEARFVGRVGIDWQVADELTQTPVPTMLLQPLLENAFKHGVEQSMQAVAIRIRIWRDGNTLRVTIHNTASTLPLNYREGFGIRNCRERLQLLYGDRAAIELRNDNEGIVASVSVPWTRGGE